MSFRFVLLDFDGTLTDPSVITDAFMADYRTEFLEETRIDGALWDEVEGAVRLASPQLGWMLDGWEACPAAADPYILASAVSTRVLASAGKTKEFPTLANDLYGRLYTRHAAPFRPETREVLEALVRRAIVTVISNASTKKVEDRLDQLLGAETRRSIPVLGNASKFSVRPATDKGPHRAAFDALPAFTAGVGVGRPTWLRRGAFFDRLAEAWGEDPHGPAHTIFCGDIWELDLVLPAALGCAVHLVERKAPLATNEVERLAVAQHTRAGMSAGLDGLLARV